MKKILCILAFIPTFGFTAVDCEYVGDDSYVIPDGQNECDIDDNSALVALVVGGGLVYWIMNSNNNDEKKAEFLNDYISGKGIRITKFESGLSVYFLPNQNQSQSSIDLNFNSIGQRKDTQSNILTFHWDLN